MNNKIFISILVSHFFLKLQGSFQALNFVADEDF